MRCGLATGQDGGGSNCPGPGDTFFSLPHNNNNKQTNKQTMPIQVMWEHTCRASTSHLLQSNNEIMQRTGTKFLPWDIQYPCTRYHQRLGTWLCPSYDKLCDQEFYLSVCLMQIFLRDEFSENFQKGGRSFPIQ